MRIGELAERTGFTRETIRYYEHEGLLPEPQRSDNNYRRYTKRHAEELLFIRYCRQLDMTLEESRTLLAFRRNPEGDCGTVNALLENHLSHVQARIRELVELESELKTLQTRCQVVRPADECGILQGLTEAPANGNHSSPSSHVPGSHGR